MICPTHGFYDKKTCPTCGWDDSIVSTLTYCDDEFDDNDSPICIVLILILIMASPLIIFFISIKY